MSRLSRTPRLAVTLGAAVFASAAIVPSAFAASPTTVKVVGSTLFIDGGVGTTNAISVANDGPGTYRIKDIGSGATLTSGGGISYAAYSTREWGVTAAVGSITSVRVRGNDLSDAINTSALTLPATLLGGSGNDILIAGSGRTTLSGSTGNDSLDGGSNSDVLIGGTGADTLSGYGGDDLFFAVDGAHDTIDGGAGDDEAAVDNDSVSNTESIIIGD